MKKPRIIRMTLKQALRRKGKTDWQRIDSMTDAEVVAAARSDPDAQPLTRRQLARMRRVIDPKAVREGTGLSQEAFARMFRLPVGTVRDWEQGRTWPDRAALNYLRVIAKRPDVVRMAIAQD
jgi:putative transcriptional regulator